MTKTIIGNDTVATALKCRRAMAGNLVAAQ